MVVLFAGVTILVSVVLSWRLVGVIVDSPDNKHREIARKTLATIWCSSVLCGGTTMTVVRLYELGVFK
jgi:hypothetical protein